jgi:RNA polymerase sigma-70 factor (ECF subfamily)
MTADRLTNLYSTYGPAIYARCRRLLGDSAAAEDATQETFMRVLRAIERAPDAREALTWIYRIATNYCLNEVRNRRGRPELRPELAEDGWPQGQSGSEERLADRDLARRLIERAAPKVRACAFLYHVDGMEQEEVARVLRVSRGTVVARLRAFEANARKFIKRSAA